tara:strand:- start:569 stop:901 length:333 start_codon:yes stop_codon:yes gene_type:complete
MINFAPIMKNLYPEEDDAQNDFKEYLQEDAELYGKERIAGEMYYDYAEVIEEELCGNVEELFKRMYSVFKGEKDEQHSFEDWLRLYVNENQDRLIMPEEEDPPPYTEQQE